MALAVASAFALVLFFPHPGGKFFFLRDFFGLGNCFMPFWPIFGGSTEKRTSTANSSHFFSLDALIMRSVRPNIVQNMCGARSTGGGGQRPKG